MYKKLKIKVFILYVCMRACVYVHACVCLRACMYACMCSVSMPCPGGQKVPEPLEPKMIVSAVWVLGFHPGPL